MKILFVCNEYPPLPHGGIGTFVRNIAREMSFRGNNVYVFCASDADFEFDDFGVRVIHKKIELSAVFGRSKCIKFISDICRERKIDIVEVPEYFGIIPIEFKFCPVVVRMHQSQSAISIKSKRFPNPILFYNERQTMVRNPNWIAVSNFVMNLNNEIFRLPVPMNLEVIPNFVPNNLRELVKNIDCPSEWPYVLFVGKVTQVKGALSLARAMKLILLKNQDLRLVYIGAIGINSGLSFDKIILDVLDETRNRVEFIGRCDYAETLRWILHARVVVLPSYLEAFPMVPLEAMMLGVPIVLTSRASGAEIVEHEEDGFLVDPDNIDEIAVSIDVCLHDDVIRQKITSNAFKKINEKFSLERSVSKTFEFYERVL